MPFRRASDHKKEGIRQHQQELSPVLLRRLKEPGSLVEKETLWCALTVFQFLDD
jgi:hypothetical protein